MTRHESVTITAIYYCDYCRAKSGPISYDQITRRLPDGWGNRRGKWVGPGYDYETLDLCPNCLAKHDASRVIRRTATVPIRAEQI